MNYITIMLFLLSIIYNKLNLYIIHKDNAILSQKTSNFLCLNYRLIIKLFQINIFSLYYKVKKITNYSLIIKNII
jgi:hypothetical protein